MPQQQSGMDGKKVLLISLGVMLVLFTTLLLYNNYQIQKQNDEFTAKLLVVNKEILANLNQLQQTLDQELSSVKNNLTLEMEIIDMSLENFRKKNEQELIALEQLIEQIETQSNIQLDELKQDLSTIQVESSDFSTIIDDVIQSVVSVGTNKGQGSGVVVDDRGFIVTNFHVIEDASLIRILTYEGKVHTAQLIGINEGLDLAMIKVDVELEDLRFGDSDDVRVGQKVIALGNPAGLSFTVTEGIVSAVHRRGPNGLEVYLQTDVPINPGNSGGPLISAESRIVGINNFKIGGFEGLGFAIESNTVEEFVDDIIDQWEEANP